MRLGVFVSLDKDIDEQFKLVSESGFTACQLSTSDDARETDEIAAQVNEASKKYNVIIENDIIDKDFTIKDMPKITDQYIMNLIHRVNNTGKFKLGIEKIKELVNEKKSVLVWGIFTGTLEKIQQELINNNISAKVIDGKITDLKEREKIINEFLTEEIQVLIANPNTLAESVSLHKQCHDAIYFEYSFNYTHMAQSRDRINRLGLNENQYTRYYYAMCGEYDDKESIDRIIYNRLQEKHDMMLQAIEAGELKSIKDNLNEDILKLLND